MNRFLFALALALLSFTGLKAQIDIPVGTSTTGNTSFTYPCPIQDWYEGSRAQYLFTATELMMAGMGPGTITGVKWNAISTNGAGVTAQYTIKMGSTSTTSLNLSAWEPSTVTQWGPQDYTPVSGLNAFSFSGGGFFWDGTSNIIVETCDGDGNSSGISYTVNATFPWTTGLSFNASHTYRNDNQGQLCGTGSVANTGTATSRPDITFVWVPANACSGDPDPGTAFSSASVVCSGSLFSLYLQGQTLASGLSYQWQSSASSSGPWTNVAGATTGAVQTSVTSDTWFRCQLQCGSSRVMSSSPVKVSVVTCINMPTPSGTFTSCGAIFYDSGGENGNYLNYENRTLTIFPATPGDKVRVTFNSFLTENKYDGLMIYDGNSNQAPLIPSGLPVGFNATTCPANSWYGTNSPGTITSSAADGSLTFVFTSDVSVVYSGWKATVSCYTPPACSGIPDPGTTLNSAGRDTICIGIPVNLSLSNANALSVFSGLSYQWMSSTDGVTFNNIIGATNPTYVPSVAGTIWYKCKVFCAASGQNGFSSVRKIMLDSSCLIMPNVGSWTTCNSTFYDSGGPTGNYNNNESKTLTIYPSLSGYKASANFLVFDLDDNYDFLYVYDGNSTSAPLIGVYSVTAPPAITSTAADGSLTFRFTSDAFINTIGWAASISCALPPVCQGAPVPGNTVASQTTLCNGSSVNLSIQNTNVSGVTYQWQTSTDNVNYTNISGATSANYVASPSPGTRWYQCFVTCTAYSQSTTSTPISVLVLNTASILTTTPDTSCGNSPFVLKATATGGTINWYQAPTGGTPLSTGGTYVTPVLSTTTNYYVSTLSAGAQVSGAKSTTTGTDASSTYGGLVFTATNNFILNSVKVKPRASGASTYELYAGVQGGGIAIYSFSYNFSAAEVDTWVTLTLNWSIPAGTYTIYKKLLSGNVANWRDYPPSTSLNTPITSFPYLIGGVVSITSGLTSGNTTNQYYNFFYDWRVTTVCESPRLQVTALVTTPPPIDISGLDTLCSGSSTDLIASSTNSNYSYTWYQVPSTSIGTGNRVTVSPASSTTYYVTGNDFAAGSAFNGCASNDTFSIYVTPAPPTPTISPASATVCSAPKWTTITSTTSVVFSPITYLYTDTIALTPYTGNSVTKVYSRPTASILYTGTSGTGGCTRTGTCALNVIPYGPLSVSIASNAASNSICRGASITFTATPPSGLTGATYRWQRKDSATTVWTDIGGTGFTSTTTYSYNTVRDGDSIRAILKGTSSCNPSGVDTVISNVIRVTVLVAPVATGTITPASNLCQGSTYTFTAPTISPSGGTVVHNWTVNAPVGNVTILSSTTGNTITIRINTGTSTGMTLVDNFTRNGCSGSYSQNFVFTSISTTSVGLSATPNPICEGGSTTFTASPANGGSAPQYGWEINTGLGWSPATGASSSSATYTTSAITAGDSVRVIMQSNLACNSGNATSPVVAVVVNPKPTGSVLGGTSVCANSTGNTFTANINQVGGTVTHSWTISGSGTITGGATTASVTVSGGASGSFTLTDNVTRNGCPGIITQLINITTLTPVTVALTGDNNGSDLCVGQNVIFTATPGNGGPLPLFQWQINPAGSGTWFNLGSQTTFNTYTLTNMQLSNNGDSIRVVVTSNSACVQGASSVTSDAIEIVVGLASVPSVSIEPDALCNGQSVTFSATPSNGGSSPNYEFFVNNVSVQDGPLSTYTIPVPAIGMQVYVVLTSSSPCAITPKDTSSVYTISSWQAAPTVSVTAPCNVILAGSGQQILLTATASAGPGGGIIEDYEWFQNVNNGVGSNQSTYSAGAAGDYTVRVTNTLGCTATSSPLTISGSSSPLTAGIYNIPGTGCKEFQTIAKAVNYINNYGIDGTGAVIFSIAGAYTETAPAGGYRILANGTASSQIIFRKAGGSNPVITAANNHTSGSISDAVFKLIGSDYVSIRDLTIQENPANFTLAADTAVATNKMTEFGIALLRGSTSNGAKYDSIAGNTISLNRVYRNSFGIYSNASHAENTPTSGSAPLDNSGSNSNNLILNNSISNVNIGIAAIGYANTGLLYFDNANVINGNTLTNWGSASVASSFSNGPASAVSGIFAANQINNSICNNTLTSATIAGSGNIGVNTRGIWRTCSVAPSGVTIADSVSGNTISLNTSFTAAGAYDVQAIRNEGISALLSTAYVGINSNVISGVTAVAGGTPTLTMIFNSSIVGALDINNNVIKSVTSTHASGGGFTGINNATASASSSTINITNNIIGDNIANNISISAGSVTGISISGTSGTAVRNVNGNTIRNLTTTGSGLLTAIASNNQTTTSNAINQNAISVLTGGGEVRGIYLLSCTNATADNNTITALKSGGATANNSAFFIQNSAVTVSNNTVSGIENTNGSATSAGAFGIYIASTTAGLTINNNSFSGIKISASSGAVAGIYTLATGGFAYNVTKNKFFDFSNIAAASTGGVYGLYLNNSTTNTVFNVNNNFISDLRNPGGGSDAIRGVGITATGANSTFNIFYNTIYLKASSALTTFGSSGIYHAANTTATTAQLVLRNNIIVNESTAGTSGATVALRRSPAASGVFNYSTSSNNNLFYAGTPGSKNLLYYDGTNSYQDLATLQAGTSRESSSVTGPAYFVNNTATPYDLHLALDNNCSADGRGDNTGILLASDIDGDTRNTSSPFNTDIGADEFAGTGVAGVWKGVNSNWMDPVNWCGGVPTATTNVVIPGNVSNFPIITTTQPIANQLTLNANASITVNSGGAIAIKGNVINDGNIINNGTILLNGTSAQSFPGGTGGQLATLNILEINNAAGVTINKPLKIKGALLPTSGAITISDTVTLLSSADSTARVGALGGSASFVYSGSGKFVVERYIPAGRKWRHLAVPTNTTQSVNAAWQEGNTPGINNNNRPGFGTIITDTAADFASRGFDYKTPGGASMKYYVSSSQSYVNLPNALAASGIKNAAGYMVFIRGDRTCTPINITTAPTTLRTAGPLYTGQQTINIPTTDTGFVSIGNPYASAVDFRQVTRSPLSVQEFMYLWDPKLTGSYGLGAFQTFFLNNGNYEAVSPDPNGSYDPINNNIQSGQAFFVRAATSGSVIFNETSKATGSRMVFRPGSNASSQILRASLNIPSANGSTLMDGLAIQFDNRYSNNVDFYDAIKLENLSENFAVINSKRLLVFERRKEVRTADTLFLNIKNTRAINYSIRINCTGMNQNGVDAWLYDRHTGVMTPLNLDGEATYDFAVQNTAGSRDAGRFMIVFRKSTRPRPVPVLITRRQAEGVMLEWDAVDQSQATGFEVLHSRNGKDFEVIARVEAEAGKASRPVYSWLHEVEPETDKYYRIRMLVAEDGRSVNSNLSRVPFLGVEGNVAIHPNPAEGKVVQIRTDDFSPGRYSVQLFNGTGQQVHAASFVHAGGAAVWRLPVSGLLSGSYAVIITSQDGRRKRLSVIIK